MLSTVAMLKTCYKTGARKLTHVIITYDAIRIANFVTTDTEIQLPTLVAVPVDPVNFSRLYLHARAINYHL